VEDLPPRIRRHEPSRVVIAADTADDLLPLAEVERRYVMRALEATGGNRTRAAKLLGVDRKTLRRKLEHKPK
jgi:two-component system response regulator HydG